MSSSQVTHHEVNGIDHVRGVMAVDVRYRAGARHTAHDVIAHGLDEQVPVARS